MKKSLIIIFTLIFSVILGACSNDSVKQDAAPKKEEKTENTGHGGHEGMHHSSSGEVPEGLKEAENPKYKVGSQAIMHTEHMEGMNGAEATISGAYDTTVYAVSYTPTTGGEKVTNHKWVIHEELENPADAPFKPGDEVTLKADHMDGMNGAKATIDSAEQTTIYMVDYTPTTGGEKVTNHKWVSESELSAE